MDTQMSFLVLEEQWKMRLRFYGTCNWSSGWELYFKHINRKILGRKGIKIITKMTEKNDCQSHLKA